MSYKCPCCGRPELGHWTRTEKLGPGFAIPSTRVVEVITSAELRPPELPKRDRLRELWGRIVAALNNIQRWTEEE